MFFKFDVCHMGVVCVSVLDTCRTWRLDIVEPYPKFHKFWVYFCLLCLFCFQVISTWGVKNKIDFLSLSYTRHAEDVRQVI